MQLENLKTKDSTEKSTSNGNLDLVFNSVHSLRSLSWWSSIKKKKIAAHSFRALTRHTSFVVYLRRCGRSPAEWALSRRTRRVHDPVLRPPSAGRRTGHVRCTRDSNVSSSTETALIRYRVSPMAPLPRLLVLFGREGFCDRI
ncbi:hypothetical protein EVAR_92936_1 [Eumeta japonica]|uniref:Uncharacterized protein n=1 Tax=Eumeta variegata TaxID=151549 RepID=A0A4C1TDQ2_EUMVA|nr:hypothetical protein EVAR_92936_1 [Eumeta japonica]